MRNGGGGGSFEVATTTAIEDGNTTQEHFVKAPPCPGLALLRYCAKLSDNREKLLSRRQLTSHADMIMEMRKTSDTRTSELRHVFHIVRFLDLMWLSMVDWEMSNLPSILHLTFALLTNYFLVSSFTCLPLALAVSFTIEYSL